MLTDEMLPEVAGQGLANYVDVFCEKSYFDVEDTLIILRKAASLGLRAKIHVNQFNSIGGVKMAVAERALSVDHLEVMEDNDFRALEGSTTIATILPSCSFFIGIPYAPARKLIESGATIALASDYNPGSSPGGNMSFIWSLACIKMRLTPAEALNALTINGAAAMELSAITGSIGKGKLANIVVYPASDSLAGIPYFYSENLVRRVMVKGNWF
jgi:imidazolonepropionase